MINKLNAQCVKQSCCRIQRFITYESAVSKQFNITVSLTHIETLRKINRTKILQHTATSEIHGPPT